MGAGARQRGDRVIRKRIADEAAETVSVERAYLSGLCSQVIRAFGGRSAAQQVFGTD